MSTQPAGGGSRAVGIAAAAAAVICLILLAFSWPTLTAEPRNVPVAITGPQQLVSQLRSGLAAGAPGAMELRTAPDRATAVTLIKEREVVGAVVLDPARPEVLTASAAGAGPSQLMSRLAQTLQARLAQQAAATGQPAPTVRSTDVVPYTSDDPTGGRLMVVAFPLVLGGVLGGALLSQTLTLRRNLLLGLVGYALLAGFGLGAILTFWYGALPGNYAVTALALSLALLATAGVVAGLGRVLGSSGIALGAALFVLGANPISGATAPREFLPEPWATIGQATPQGAGWTLLRDLSYFPDASTGAAWLVLACWAAAGLLLIMITRPRPARQPQHGAGRAQDPTPTTPTSTATTAAAR